MQLQFYAVRIEAEQLVAAEVTDAVAAELLAGGSPVLLATEAEVDRLARRLGKARTVIFRPAPAARRTPVAETRREPQPAPMQQPVGLLQRLMPRRRLKVA